MAFKSQAELRLFLLIAGFSFSLCGNILLGADGSIADQAEATDAVLREPRMLHGAEIYRRQCAACHGDVGQGVNDRYSDPLVGDATIGELTRIITETMPEENPETCVGDDAASVSEFLHYAFYSEAAQVRNRPPRVGLARLTAIQLRQSLADLFAIADGLPNVTDKRGVKGIYFDGDRWKDDQKRIERVDPVIDFDFGKNGPGEKIQPDAFYIYWEGGLKVDLTGEYEIVVHSTCSFQMDFGKVGRTLIDNHVQSGDKTEFRERMTLTAGRVYPFKIDFIQRKRKTELPPAKVSLSWVPPSGVEQIIPAEHLIPEWTPPTFSLQTALPPDDRSYGYERGIAISPQWDESTTAAALEFAQIAIDELCPTYRDKHKNDSDENRGRLHSFLSETVKSAFRGRWDEAMQQRFVDYQVEATLDDAEATKRSLLISLKSPWFLYPQADNDRSASERAATRVALILFDSLPTQDSLLKAVAKNSLETSDQIRNHVRSSMNDYRVQAKIRQFLNEWLNLAGSAETVKDSKEFPGFDAMVVSDLRASLDKFLDEVVLNEKSDYRQLFTSNWMITNDRLSRFYGDAWQPAENGVGLRRSREDGHVHHGVLTHPLLMSRLAYHDTTSPIHRGVFLIRYILGRTLRPPADAFAPLSPDLHPDLTTRERVSLQTSPDACQVCHVKINNLGFVLENYDSTGRFRDKERGKVVESFGYYSARDGKQLNFSGADELAKYLTESDDAQQAFVTRAFQHFVKQPVAAFGPETLDRLLKGFRHSNFNIRELIVEITVIGAQLP